MPFSHNELTEVLGRHRWTAQHPPCAGRRDPARERRSPERKLPSSRRPGTLDLIFPAGLSGIRIADLGCLEGGYSLALALRGADVTGIEADGQLAVAHAVGIKLQMEPAPETATLFDIMGEAASVLPSGFTSMKDVLRNLGLRSGRSSGWTARGRA